MLGCHIPSHHIFLVINLPNSEVEHLHKFEQAAPILAIATSIDTSFIIHEVRNLSNCAVTADAGKWSAFGRSKES